MKVRTYDHPPIVEKNNSGEDAWLGYESGIDDNDALGSESEEETLLSKIARSMRCKKIHMPSMGIEIQFEMGQIFEDVYHFKFVLKDYTIQRGSKVVREKKEKARVTTTCAGPICQWRIHASSMADGKTF